MVAGDDTGLVQVGFVLTKYYTASLTKIPRYLTSTRGQFFGH